MVTEKTFIYEECHAMVCLEDGYKALNQRKCIYTSQTSVPLNIPWLSEDFAFLNLWLLFKYIYLGNTLFRL